MHIGERLGCDDDVFLSQIVDAYETDGRAIGPETTLAVRGLKQAIIDIRQADDSYGRERLASIDATFFDLDELAYTENHVGGFQPGSSLTKRLTRANRQQIVEFGLWYRDRVAQLGEQLRTDQPVLAADVRERTEGLISQGIFPPAARNLMHQTTLWGENIKPIGSVEQAANMHSGYCHRWGIGLANQYLAPNFPAVIGLQLKQTSFHEHLHGIGHLGRERRGLFYGLAERHRSNYNRWLEEAYVATVSEAAIKQGSKPGAVALVQQSYLPERTFLQVAMEVSPTPLSLLEISEAHFSGRHPRAAIRTYVANGFNNGLNDLFPEYGGTAWDRINADYEAIPHRLKREEYMTDLLLKASTRSSLVEAISNVA